METGIIISTFTDPREAYLLRFKLNLEGIDSYIIESNNNNLTDKNKRPPLQVQVNAKDVEKAVTVLCNIKASSEFSNIEDKIKNIKRLLVPIDFSEYSKTACLFAFSVAKSIGAEIKILHVYNDPFADSSYSNSRISYENFSQSVLREVEQMVESNMLKFINDLEIELKKHDFGNIKYHYNLKKGKPEHQIIKLSTLYKPYLIILGTKGVGQMPNDIIGSVTLKVIENTDVPILAIPEKWKFKSLDLLEILYATDFHDSDFTAFNKLLEILKPFKAKFDCVHIEFDESNPWKEMQMFKLESFLGQNYSEHEIKCHIIKHNNLIEGIQEFVDSKGIDIISFTSPRRNIFQKLIMPNNLKKMIFQSTIPLLIFHSDI